MRFGIILLLGTACINIEDLETVVNKSTAGEDINLDIGVDIVLENVDITEGNETDFKYDSTLKCVVFNGEEEVLFEEDANIYSSKYTWFINDEEIPTDVDQATFDRSIHPFGYGDEISCLVDVWYKESTTSESHIEYDGDENSAQIEISNTVGIIESLQIVNITNNDSEDLFNDGTLECTAIMVDPDIFEDSKESVTDFHIKFFNGESEPFYSENISITPSEDGIITASTTTNLSEHNISPNQIINCKVEIETEMDGESNTLSNDETTEFDDVSIFVENRLPDPDNIQVTITGDLRVGDTLTCDAFQLDNSIIVDPDQTDENDEELSIIYVWKYTDGAFEDAIHIGEGASYELNSEQVKGNQVYCEASIFDRHIGPEGDEVILVSSETQTIQNFPTDITGITPEINSSEGTSFTTNVDLTCIHVEVPTEDLDENELFTFTYQWIVNGVELTNQTQSTLPSSETTKNDSITCSVNFIDEQGNESDFSTPSQSINIQNYPTDVSGITPEITSNGETTLTTDLDLTCTHVEVPTEDLDENELFTFTYQWIVNGVELTNQTQSTLPSSETTKNDSITCSVNFVDEQGNESDFSASSQSVNIANSPPSIQESDILLLPSGPVLSGDSVSCAVTDSNDPDLDSISFLYEWIVDETVINVDESGSQYTEDTSVTHTAVGPGELQCRVTPKDSDEVTGSTVLSTTVVIENTAPDILSEPILQVENPDNIASTFTCTAEGTDPDNQTLTYTFGLYSELAGNSTLLTGEVTSATDSASYLFDLTESEIYALVTDPFFNNGGDTFTCKVTVSDGVATSAEMQSNPQLIYPPCEADVHIDDVEWFGVELPSYEEEVIVELNDDETFFYYLESNNGSFQFEFLDENCIGVDDETTVEEVYSDLVSSDISGDIKYLKVTNLSVETNNVAISQYTCHDYSMSNAYELILNDANNDIVPLGCITDDTYIDLTAANANNETYYIRVISNNEPVGYMFQDDDGSMIELPMYEPSDSGADEIQTFMVEFIAGSTRPSYLVISPFDSDSATTIEVFTYTSDTNTCETDQNGLCTACELYEMEVDLGPTAINSSLYYSSEEPHIYEIPDSMVGSENIVVQGTQDVVFYEGDCQETELPFVIGSNNTYDTTNAEPAPKYVGIYPNGTNINYSVYLQSNGTNNNGGNTGSECNNALEISTSSNNFFNIGVNASKVLRFPNTINDPYIQDFIATFKLQESSISVQLLGGNCDYISAPAFEDFNTQIDSTHTVLESGTDVTVAPRHLLFDYADVGPVYLRIENDGTSAATGELYLDNCTTIYEDSTGSASTGCKIINLGSEHSSINVELEDGSGHVLFRDANGKFITSSTCDGDCFGIQQTLETFDNYNFSFENPYCNSDGTLPNQIILLRESFDEINANIFGYENNICETTNTQDCLLGGSFDVNGNVEHSLGSDEEFDLCPGAGLWLDLTEPTGSSNNWKIEVGTEGTDDEITQFAFFESVSMSDVTNEDPFEASGNDLFNWSGMSADVASISGECHDMFSFARTATNAFINGAKFTVYIGDSNSCDVPQSVYIKNTGDNITTFKIRSSVRPEYAFPSYADSLSDCEDLDEDNDGINDCEEYGCNDGFDNNSNNVKDCDDAGCTQICSLYESGDQNGWVQKVPTNMPNPRSECYMTFDESIDKVVMFGGKDGTNYLSDLWFWDGDNSEWISAPIESGTETPTYQEGMVYYYDQLNGTTNYLTNAVAGTSTPTIWQLKYIETSNLVNWVKYVNYNFNYSYPHYAWDGNRLILQNAASSLGMYIIQGFAPGFTITSPTNDYTTKFDLAAVTYDPNVGMLKVGGYDGNNIRSNMNYVKHEFNDDGSDTLVNGSLGTPSTRPDGRYAAQIVHYDIHGVNILFGGMLGSTVDDSIATDETIVLGFDSDQNPSYINAIHPINPAARSHHCMAYDSSRDEIIMFGGKSDDESLLQDTWVYKHIGSE